MSPMEPPSPTDSGIRKRVCKACDRCRLKKSKCDGANPCSRCKTDNAICFFGERKKSHDKVYPKGYVEMLESQQAQLVTGLQELYKRVQTGSGWTGSPLKDSLNGAPLTHDILERLGALKQEGSTNEHFEENLEALQQRLVATTTDMHRTQSFDLGMDSAATSPLSDGFANPGSYVNSYANSQFPPTPPSHSPHPILQHQNSSMDQSFSFDPSHMNQYNAYSSGFLDEEVEQLMTMKPGSDYMDPSMMFSPPGLSNPGVINPFQTMKDWDSMPDLRQYQPHP